MYLRKMTALLLAISLCLCLGGCFVKSADELYALPKHSDEYFDLQEAINAVLVGGALYSSPVSGSNQQSVQLADLDGDGEDEAVAFIRKEGVKPLKAYIFDRVDGNYVNTCVIEGDGSAFDQVDYAQMDGRGGMEIIIGRQVSNQVLQSISVYSIADGVASELVSENYTEYRVVDLDGNGLRDLFLLRLDAEERTGVAELYRYVQGAMEREPEVSMSMGVDTVKRIVTGAVEGGTPAVFVGGVVEDSSIITDVFMFNQGAFTKVSSVDDLHLRSDADRGYFVYATDVDSDGNVEIPDTVRLLGGAGDSPEDAYYAIRWYQYKQGTGVTLDITTYHSYAGGWYLKIPEEWETNFSVGKGTDISGMKGVSFYQNMGQGEPFKTIMTIYSFTGSDNAAEAGNGGRIIVGAKGDTTYAVALGTAPWAQKLTKEKLTAMFNYIWVDWNSGET